MRGVYHIIEINRFAHVAAAMFHKHFQVNKCIKICLMYIFHTTVYYY